MKQEHEYEIDTAVVEALGTTLKSLRDMKDGHQQDRLANHEDTVSILTDIIRQCNHIAGVLSKDDITFGMTEKQYEFLKEGIRTVSMELTDFNIRFAKRVPTRIKGSTPRPTQMVS
jgi:hypothetical protein